jgi:hypothetical protein
MPTKTAVATGVTKETVSEVCQKFTELEKSDKASAEHATDFDAPIYNIWKQQDKTQFANFQGRFN